LLILTISAKRDGFTFFIAFGLGVILEKWKELTENEFFYMIVFDHLEVSSDFSFEKVKGCSVERL
jgi:hypothetical protein